MTAIEPQVVTRPQDNLSMYRYHVHQIGMYFSVNVSNIPAGDVQYAIDEFTRKYGEEPKLVRIHKEAQFPPEFVGSLEVERTGAVLPGKLWVGTK